MQLIKTLKDVPKEEFLVGGSTTCSGCGSILGLKLALKVLGKNTIVINASGCITLTPTYPYTPYLTPFIHLAMENAAAAASGIWAALKRKNPSVNIVCYAGDGATYNIGLQALSGAIDRGDNFIYICYNNQSYANTGVQQSGATPYGAYTTTTPTSKKNPIGNLEPAKPLTRIIAAHRCPYVATACVAYPMDYMRKLQRAAAIKGPKFIDLLCPCQPGWGFDSSQTVKIGKLAVSSGMWPLYEIVDGKLKLTMHFERLEPVEKYLKAQKRFKHLGKEAIKRIQSQVNERWKRLKKGEF